MVSYMKTGSTAELEEAGKSNAWVFAINIIFAIVSLVMTVVFILYFFCKACCACLCCCCKDELEQDLGEKPGDSAKTRAKKARLRKKRDKKIKMLKSKGCTMFLMISSIILVTVIIILGFIWIINMFKAVSGAKKSDCAISYFFNDLIEGVNNENEDGTTSLFIGLNGFDYFLEEIKTNIDTIAATNLDTVALATAKDNLLPSLETFYNTHTGNTVTSCTGTGTATLVSTSSTMLTSQINEVVGTAYTYLSTAAEAIAAAGDAVTAVAADSSTYTSSITTMQDTLSGFGTNLEDARTSFNDAADINKYATYASLVAYFLGMGTLVVMICSILIMACSLKGWCTTVLTCLEAILAIVKMFFAFFINVVAVGTLLITIILVNVCRLAYESLSDEDLASSLLPDSMSEFVELCLYESSTGDLTGNMGDTIADQISQINDLGDGLSYDLEEFNLTDTTPYVIQFYIDEVLEPFKTYVNDDFATDPTNGPSTQIDDGNAIVSCTNDEWALNSDSCTKSPVSVNTDDFDTTAQTTDYCMIPIVFGTSDATTRYSGAASCASSAASIWTNLYTCLDDHQNLMETMIETSLGTDNTPDTTTPIGTWLTVTAEITTLQSDFETLQTSLNNVVDFVSSTAEDMSSMANCKIIRTEMRILFGNMCYSFNSPLVTAAVMMAIIGPCMTVLAFCLCCVYRQANAVDDYQDMEKQKKKELKKKQLADGDQGDPQLQQAPMMNHPPQQQGYVHGQAPQSGYR